MGTGQTTVKMTKEFQARLMSLKKSGQKASYQQAMMVLSEMAGEFAVSKSFRAETRIPNCLKYELPQHYRMVFQRVESEDPQVLALFVGKHEDVDRFLDNHKGWIFDPKTHGLREHRLVSIEGEQTNMVPSPDLKGRSINAETSGDRESAFGDLGSDLLRQAGVPAELVEEAITLQDPDSFEMMQFLEAVPDRTSDLLLSYLTGGREMRLEVLELLKGNREYHPSLSQSIVPALSASSDHFVDLRDLSEEQLAFETMPLEDWMLFLHPDQKQLAVAPANGPARLRGVSGSGKTVVAIHRARHIARTLLQSGIGMQVLFLTYNRSLADMVDRQLSRLCTRLERNRIQVETIDKWCRDFVTFCLGSLPPWDNRAIEEVWDRVLQDHVHSLEAASIWDGAEKEAVPFKWNRNAQFLKDEVEFIFGKFIHEDVAEYLDCDRKGRGRRLTKKQRAAVLELYTEYAKRLTESRQYVARELNRIALKLLREGSETESKYHAVIVDEVQDLSEIDLQVCSELASADSDQLFLVGDGAQRIYTRGYSMKGLGINVVGRSYVLRRNFRNTHQIMQVGNALMSAEGIGRYDDDPEVAQAGAIVSSHEGDSPLFMVARSPQDEWAAICREIKYLSRTVAVPYHEICCLTRSSWERKGLHEFLGSQGVPCVDYRAEGIGNEGFVKISSLHNAKGHEFRVVFVFGLFEGAVPIYGATEPEDLEREAALLYVAITRAKELLYLSYPKCDENGRSLEPSRFLDAIQEHVEEIELV